ncbi:MAG: 4Fe-4S dicluster domain-containing protein [Christensenellales bacterium]
MRQTVRKNPAECTGCGACVSICPKQAIVMQPDTEGFLYPKVDGEKCISCDLCESGVLPGGNAGASCAAARRAGEG